MGNTSRNCQSREGVLNSAPSKKSRALLAVDGSEHALAASQLFRALNVPGTSQVTVRHVVEPAEEIESCNGIRNQNSRMILKPASGRVNPVLMRAPIPA